VVTTNELQLKRRKNVGTSIDPTATDRVFDLKFTTTAHRLGTGLAICCSIIEAYGGRISASLNLPREAIFPFTTPACPLGNSIVN
jgi:two-component system sensor kinase FixL